MKEDEPACKDEQIEAVGMSSGEASSQNNLHYDVTGSLLKGLKSLEDMAGATMCVRLILTIYCSTHLNF